MKPALVIWGVLSLWMIAAMVAIALTQAEPALDERLEPIKLPCA